MSTQTGERGLGVEVQPLPEQLQLNMNRISSLQ